MVIVPVIQELTGTQRKSLLTASILLGIMILPTIISVAESSLNAVPDSYYEGAIGIGGPPTSGAFFRPYCRRQNPASCPASSWA